MKPYELSKPQKKIARTLIEYGLMKEFHNGIMVVDEIIREWKNNKLDNREAYLKIYKKLDKFDDHISNRYDNLSSSNYMFILAHQLSEGLVTVDELDELDEKIRAAVLFLATKRN
jgi:hypothetical protein